MDTPSESPVVAHTQKRKDLIISVVAIVLLAIVGGGAWVFGGHAITGSNPTEAQLQQQADKLIKAGNPVACTAISNATYRSVCTNDIALNKAETTGDLSYCKQMDGTLVTQKYCEQEAILSYSIQTNDVNACKKTSNSELQTLCIQNFYATIAQKSQDPTVCQQASSPDDCTTTYYLQKMYSNPSAAHCGDFPTTDTQSDCTLLQGLLAHASTSPATLLSFQTTCQKMKTAAFKQFCMTLEQRTVSLSRS